LNFIFAVSGMTDLQTVSRCLGEHHRLTLSLLPMADDDQKLKLWAARLRDEDERWQKLFQDGVQLFMGLIVDQLRSFAFETVFSLPWPIASSICRFLNELPCLSSFRVGV